MRNYLSRQRRAFSPETVQLLVAAFDRAWATVQRFDGINDQNREAMRLELARRILELWDAADRTPETIADAALASFHLKRPGSERSA